jgi:hypothetical protein
MPVGRPQKADPGTLYSFAHLFYWDLRRLAEGSVRWHFDEEKYRQLMEKVDEVQLDRFRREERLLNIGDTESCARERYRQQAEEEATKEIKVPGELGVIQVLLNPKTTPQQIRNLCKDATMITIRKIGSEVREAEVPAWPIPVGSTLPTYLAQYAEQYISALRDRRFPRCDVSTRPTNQLKQFWFLSRALAGALYGVTTRTAINLVGSLRPEQMFHKSRYGKPARKLRRVKRK